MKKRRKNIKKELNLGEGI